MDIVLASIMFIVGIMFVVSSVFEFGFACPSDAVGAGVGVIMMIIGAQTLYGAL